MNFASIFLRRHRRGIAFAFLVAATATAPGVDLKVDINDRDATNNTPANTEGGFATVAMSTSPAGLQSGTLTATFGAQTVTITSSGPGTVNYDDRKRASPVNSGSFTQQALLQDFIFAAYSTTVSESTNGGLDVEVAGLTAGKEYAITLWSYDNGSPGSRISDWSANGVLKVEDYSFNGSTLPTTNEQYQMNFTSVADGTGKILIQGRRDSNNTSHGVFLNALWIRDLFEDADTDGMSDGWETAHGLIVGTNDAALDPDNDFSTNLQEFQADTDPQDNDTDNDTLLDSYEKKTGLWVSVTDTGTSPLLADSDADGLSDSLENPSLPSIGPAQPGTNPNLFDTDGDSFSDSEEINWPSNPLEAAEFPNPAAGGTLAVDLENTTEFVQRGMEFLPGPGTVDATSVSGTFGTYSVTVSAVGSTTLLSRDRDAAAGGAGFNPLFRDFIFAQNGADDGDGLDVTITGLAPFTTYPVTLWSWDATSANPARNSTWLSKDAGHPPSVKVPSYVINNAATLPTGAADRRMQFDATSDSTGNLVIQGRKQAGFVPLTPATVNVLLNGFVIGMAGVQLADGDNDDIPDGWELTNGLNPADPDDSDDDPDMDSSTNLQEFLALTNPNLADTDGDTLLDGYERETGLWVGVTNTGTNPRVADSDGDGLPDNVENPSLPSTGPAQPGTNPNMYDTDADSFSDGEEINWPTSPIDQMQFPNPSAGATLAIDLENTTANVQLGFVGLLGPGAAPGAASVFLTAGVYTATINAVGSTMLESRDRGAASAIGGFTPLFQDFVFATTSNDDGDGMDVIITGLEPLTNYPVTLWSWDSGSAGTPRHSTWLASDGNNPPAVKVSLYVLSDGADLPNEISDRRTQFIAMSDSTGQLVIQGRKEEGYTGSTINVFLNGFIIGAPVTALSPLVVTGLGPLTAAGFPLTWTSDDIGIYRVDTSPDLTQWQTLAAAVDGQAGTTTFTDTTIPAGQPKRYYRVSRVSP